jgi:hypothetical protein
MHMHASIILKFFPGHILGLPLTRGGGEGREGSGGNEKVENERIGRKRRERSGEKRGRRNGKMLTREEGRVQN